MSPFSAKTPTARKGSLKPAQLTGYLAGAVGTAALLGSPQAEAAVTAVSFGFGPEFTHSDGTAAFAVNGQGGSYGALQGWGLNPGFIALGWDMNRPGTGAVYEDDSRNNGYQGVVTFFNNGSIIGNGTHGTKGMALFEFGANQLDKNIGFKTSSNNYGWANVSWSQSTSTITVNEAWVESAPNTAITITQVPEPSRALLALAGLGGVALRRRRKQAA